MHRKTYEGESLDFESVIERLWDGVGFESKFLQKLFDGGECHVGFYGNGVPIIEL